MIDSLVANRFQAIPASFGRQPTEYLVIVRLSWLTIVVNDSSNVESVSINQSFSVITLVVIDFKSETYPSIASHFNGSSYEPL